MGQIQWETSQRREEQVRIGEHFTCKALIGALWAAEALGESHCRIARTIWATVELKFKQCNLGGGFKHPSVSAPPKNVGAIFTGPQLRWTSSRQQITPQRRVQSTLLNQQTHIIATQDVSGQHRVNQSRSKDGLAESLRKAEEDLRAKTEVRHFMPNRTLLTATQSFQCLFDFVPFAPSHLGFHKVSRSWRAPLKKSRGQKPDFWNSQNELRRPQNHQGSTSIKYSQ